MNFGWVFNESVLFEPDAESCGKFLVEDIYLIKGLDMVGHEAYWNNKDVFDSFPAKLFKFIFGRRPKPFDGSASGLVAQIPYEGDSFCYLSDRPNSLINVGIALIDYFLRETMGAEQDVNIIRDDAEVLKMTLKLFNPSFN